MEIQILPDNFDTKLFNDKAINPLQSWEWGEARKKLGTEVVRLGEFNNESLIDIYQITLHPIPLTSYKLGYIGRSRYPSKAVCNFLMDYGKRNNIVFFKVEPYQRQDSGFKIDDPRIMRNSPHPLFPDWTIILDIDKSEEELLKNMKQKTRYNIRLAQKKGVVVKEESTEKGFELFSKLYFETCKRQKYHGHTPHYHKVIWETLKNNIAHILIAYYEGTPLATYELFHFHDTLYYPYGGTSLEYRNLMGSNIVMWESIKLGKKLGAKTFDMWGSLQPDYPENHPWAGFTRLKEGYGGEFVQMAGSYDLVVNNNMYVLYNSLHKLRSLYLKVRS